MPSAPRLTRAAMAWRELPFLRRAEVCEVLGIGLSEVDRLIASDELRVRRVGRRVLVLTSSVVEWVEGPKVEPQVRLVSAEDRRRVERDARRLVRRMG